MSCLLVLVAVLAAAGCNGANDANPKAAGGSGDASRTGAPSAGAGGGVELKAPPAGALVLNPENTKIEFVGTKPDGRHEGGFKNFKGGVELPGNDASAAKISVDIDTTSLYADNPKLTGHLKTPDFFDVKTHPKASFVTTAIKPDAAGGGTHTVTGDLTLHGVTKSISFPATIDLKPDAFSLNSEFKINRGDFGMTYGAGKVDDPVTIKVSLRAPRK